MKKNQFKNLIMEAREDRRDPMLQGLAFMLQKNKNIIIDDIDDFDEFYDNLEINNEIITSDNVDDYDIAKLLKDNNIRLKPETFKRKIQQGKGVLLNYYSNVNRYGEKVERWQLVNCFAWFDVNYTL
jgi:hypothetical protein